MEDLVSTALVGDAREIARRLLVGQPPLQPGQLVASIYVRASSDRFGRGKSVERQVEDCWADCQRHGWFVVGIFIDNDRSASVYATKDREEYDAMTASLRRSPVDVLVCWEASRATRDMQAYLDLSKLSRDLDIKWCFNGTTFDLRDPDDEFRTMFDVVLGHREVRVLAQRSRQGIAKAARDGKPHGGPTPYGYFRRYDERTRQFAGQEVDTIPRDVFDVSGNPVTFTPAEVVREIFTRIAGGDSCWNTIKDLNRRGIPGPTGKPWAARTVRNICLNPAYTGQRSHRGALSEGIWDGLVDEAMFRATLLRLEDPKRRTSRTNKARHMLSYIVTCGVCHRPMSAARRKRSTPNSEVCFQYHCSEGRCVSIRCERLDAYVESVLIDRLAKPETLDWLVRPDDLAAQHAAEEAAELRSTVDKWKAKAKAGQVDPDDFHEIVSGLRDRIAELEAVSTPSYVPMALRGLIGEQAAQVWDGLKLPTRRDILRTVMTVSLAPATRTGRAPFDPSRVSIDWPLDAKVPETRRAA
jgi:DNA invertase Pin-like site-specific DNA recombinase